MTSDIVGGIPLDPELLRGIDAYWRAANYLAVGQIYLRANPLLKGVDPKKVKPRILTLTQSTYDGVLYNTETIKRSLDGYDAQQVFDRHARRAARRAGGVEASRRRAVRLLPVGSDHDGGRAARGR